MQLRKNHKIADTEVINMGKAGRPFGTLKYDNLEDLQNGIDKYFDDCKESGEPPTLEDLADSLNISIKTLWNYGQEGYGD